MPNAANPAGRVPGHPLRGIPRGALLARRPLTPATRGRDAPSRRMEVGPGEGFVKHLRDAIAINLQRRTYYSRLTGGRSEALTDRLVWQERLALLVAYYFDFRARSFQRQGIPIISGDFVPMSGVRPAGAPVTSNGVATAADLDAARNIVRDLGRQVDAALGRSDFARVAKACYEALAALEALEGRTGAAFTMSRHVIESLGLGSLNARDHAAASGGRTVGLSRQFLRAQSWALGTTVETDRLAQPLNARGVGILVNDVPAIPFMRRYRAENEQPSCGARPRK